LGLILEKKSSPLGRIGNFPGIQTLPEKNQVADLDWLTRRKRLEELEEYIYIYMYLDTYIRTHRCIRTSTIIN